MSSPHTSAYARFLGSIEMNFERWHDGVGIDLAGVTEMTADERQNAFDLLLTKPQTWREAEALATLARAGVRDSASWVAGLRRTAADPYQSSDDRLIALSTLNDLGELPDFDRQLAALIRKLTTDGPALTRALLLAEEHPTETVKQALLWATWNRTPAAPFCAGLVCYLAEVTDEPFDFARRDLFLRFGMQSNYFDRQAAFAELCMLVGMTFQPEQD